MQPTTETIQGELLALRCHIAALMESQPLQSQLRFRAKLETSLLLLRPAQSGERQAAFDRAANSLAVKRQPRLDTDRAEAHSGERR